MATTRNPEHASHAEITELMTALGMLEFDSLASSLESPPVELLHVDEATWTRLQKSYEAEPDNPSFEVCWKNGLAFLEADGALRGRRPLAVEWKGPHKNKGDASMPADLRIDHVYMVSCKYLSKNIQSPSPNNLFNAVLVEAQKQHNSPDWYEVVAPDEYQSFYASIRTTVDQLSDLPERLVDVSDEQRPRLIRAAMDVSHELVAASYATLCKAVGTRSAQIWNQNLKGNSAKEHMLWRLIRLQSSPYFLLGQSQKSSMRFRIGTPWDWSVRFKFVKLHITPDVVAGQPTVRWVASVIDRETGEDREVRGHIEIRWSHKKFTGRPEAKIYIDTPFSELPGYFEI